MGVFERVLQQQHPTSDTVQLTACEAFAAIVIGAFNADGRSPQEEAGRANEIFSCTRLFRQGSAPPLHVVLERVSALFQAYGIEAVLSLAANALPAELHRPVFIV